MILGLDISTSIIGVTILDGKSGISKKISHISFNKKMSLWDKVFYFKKQIIKFVDNKEEIKFIVIEEPLSRFTKGRSSSHTISLLLKFNGILSFILYQEFGVEPEYFTPSQARKLCGVVLRKKNQCRKLKIKWEPEKIQTFNQIKKRFFNDYPWQYKRTGKIKDFHYDEVDSFVIALAKFRNMSNMY